ncbi:MAG: DUF1003 domain-containing protein [Novosphingobium sp.]|nr:DUF1003 domain-containing protein [Novosphingobium sp.]
MRHTADPKALARELLGRDFDTLARDEQQVLEHLASAKMMWMDSDEVAQAHATFGDKLADRVAAVGGSWAFIGGFGVVLVAWVLLNSPLVAALGFPPFDRYPFIFLNLVLSMLAAVQAPIIMMSQNRQAAKDRIAARHDYEVNLRAQMELIRLSQKVDRLVKAICKDSPEGDG